MQEPRRRRKRKRSPSPAWSGEAPRTEPAPGLFPYATLATSTAPGLPATKPFVITETEVISGSSYLALHEADRAQQQITRRTLVDPCGERNDAITEDIRGERNWAAIREDIRVEIFEHRARVQHRVFADAAIWVYVNSWLDVATRHDSRVVCKLWWHMYSRHGSPWQLAKRYFTTTACRLPADRRPARVDGETLWTTLRTFLHATGGWITGLTLIDLLHPLQDRPQDKQPDKERDNERGKEQGERVTPLPDWSDASSDDEDEESSRRKKELGPFGLPKTGYVPPESPRAREQRVFFGRRPPPIEIVVPMTRTALESDVDQFCLSLIRLSGWARLVEVPYSNSRSYGLDSFSNVWLPLRKLAQIGMTQRSRRTRCGEAANKDAPANHIRGSWASHLIESIFSARVEEWRLETIERRSRWPIRITFNLVESSSDRQTDLEREPVSPKHPGLCQSLRMHPTLKNYLTWNVLSYDQADNVIHKRINKRKAPIPGRRYVDTEGSESREEELLEHLRTAYGFVGGKPDVREAVLSAVDQIKIGLRKATEILDQPTSEKEQQLAIQLAQISDLASNLLPPDPPSPNIIQLGFYE